MKNSILQAFRESAFAARVFAILVKLHIDSPFLHWLHRKDIVRSSRFFNQNSDRVSGVCEFLQDDASRAIYLASIRFRQSYARRDAPEYTREQYFPDDVVKLTDHEVFVDCGAFTGDTAGQFVAQCGNRFERIVCFEPDPTNFAVLNRAHADDRIVKIPSGVWNENTTLTFKSGKSAGSKVSASGKENLVSVHVVAIDEVPECQNASFVKMDIEGAEMNALRGARRIIGANRPKLAVSIYHSDEEMLAIPEYLHAALESYSFFVRHHSMNWQDTVLYAIPKQHTARG